MTGKDLLLVMGQVDEKYVQEAEFPAPSKATRGRFEKKPARRPLGRILLIAAALSLLLAGCAYAVLRLQDMKLGERTGTKKFDEYGKRIGPTEVTVELFTPHGPVDSPMQLATREWEAYLDTLPEGLWRDNLDNALDIPDSYYFTYNCENWDMVHKLDEIADKYNLKLLGKFQIAQWYQKEIMYEALGIDGVTRPGAAKTFEYGSEFYPNGNFESELDFTMLDENSPWPGKCFATYVYMKRDTFQPFVSGVIAGDYDQWNYTTADGTDVLLVLESNGEAQILAQQTDAAIYISITPDLPGVYPRDDSQIPTKEALEQMADVFDYTIRPREIDMDAIKIQLDAAEAEYQAQHTFELPEYHSFGEYLNAQYYPEELSYCMLDYDADGQDDMLLGYGDNTFRTILFQRDGIVEEFSWADKEKICEGGVIESSFNYAFSSYVTYEHRKFPEENGKINYASDDAQFLEHLERRNGVWYKNTEEWPSFELDPSSEEEAQSILSRYKPIQLNWQPALSYPMDDKGTTLAQYMKANDPCVTKEGLWELYRDCALRNLEKDLADQYALMDANGDGKVDLLVGKDNYFRILTEHRGRVCLAGGGTSLCEDQVIYSFDISLDEENCEYETHEFLRIEGNDRTELACVRQNVSTDTWYIDLDGPEISEAEAREILAKYIPLEVDWKPISELKTG